MPRTVIEQCSSSSVGNWCYEVILLLDHRYVTGNYFQRKLKWPFGTWSPFTEDNRMGILYTVAMHGQLKGKLASVPDDCVPVACNCLSPVHIHSTRCKVRWYMAEYNFFSFFQNAEMNTVTGTNLIDIIGILSGDIEAKTHHIPAVFDWVMAPIKTTYNIKPCTVYVPLL